MADSNITVAVGIGVQKGQGGQGGHAALKLISHVLHHIAHVIKGGFDGRLFFLSSTFYLSMAADGFVLSSSFCSLFLQTLINSAMYAALPGVACMLALAFAATMIALAAIATIREEEYECKQHAKALREERRQRRMNGHQSPRRKKKTKHSSKSNHGRQKGSKKPEGHSRDHGKVLLDSDLISVPNLPNSSYTNSTSNDLDEGPENDADIDDDGTGADELYSELHIWQTEEEGKTSEEKEELALKDMPDDQEEYLENEDDYDEYDDYDDDNDNDNDDDEDEDENSAYEQDILQCPMRTAPNVTCKSYDSGSVTSPSVYGINKFNWYSLGRDEENEHDISNCYPQLSFGTKALAALIVKGYTGLKYDYEADTATVIVSTIEPRLVEEQILSALHTSTAAYWLGILNAEINWISFEYHDVLSTSLNTYESLHSALLTNGQDHWAPLRSHYCLCGDAVNTATANSTGINSRALLADLYVNGLSSTRCSIQDCWQPITTLRPD